MLAFSVLTKTERSIAFYLDSSELVVVRKLKKYSIVRTSVVTYRNLA